LVAGGGQRLGRGVTRVGQVLGVPLVLLHINEK